jgi:glycosyltransferase involved in cell wall biosynthesis
MAAPLTPNFLDADSLMTQTWIDISAALTQRAGVARYSRELVKALSRSNDYAHTLGDRLGLYSCGGHRPTTDLPQLPFCGTRLNPRAWRAALLIGHLIRRPLLPGLHHFDLFHATDLAYPFAAPRQTLVTVHDLSIVRYPQYHSAFNRFFQRCMLRLLVDHGHHVIAVSQFTARELRAVVQIPEDRVHVVYPGVAPIFLDEPSSSERQEVLRRYGLERPFVLTVATREPRKNLARLLEGFTQIGPPGKVTLALAGHAGWGTDVASGRSQQSNVRWLGYVPDKDLRSLYREASVFAYPSLYEGFGSPVAEALVSGCPVVCSASCGVVELARDAVRLVDPLSATSIAEGIATAMDGPASQGRAGSFALSPLLTYEDAAPTVWQLYDSLLG